MEYIRQRSSLRRPKLLDYSLTKDPAHLDGGGEAWRRFKEKSLLRQGYVIYSKRARRRQIEQLNLTVHKDAMNRELWKERADGNADGEGQRVCDSANDKSNSVAVKDDPNDSNDDDGDDEDNGTIYSRASADQPTAYNLFSDNSVSSSTATVDSSIVAFPCRQHTPFDWADNVEMSESAGEVIVPTLSDQGSSTVSDGAKRPATCIQSDFNPLMEALERNRTLGWELSAIARRKHKLSPYTSYCAWKLSPLDCNFEAHKATALSRLTKGRCPSERTPTIIVTDDNGDHYRLQEVKNILQEDEITEIRQRRDAAQKEHRIKKDRYDVWNKAALEGQTAAERLATDAAKAWWAAEQQKRNSAYQGWQYAEAHEFTLLKLQIKHDIDQHFEHLALSKAREESQQYITDYTALQIESLADLQLRMAQDGLVPTDNANVNGNGNGNANNGVWTSPAYSVRLTDRALTTFRTRRAAIDATALKLAEVRIRRKQEISQRRADWRRQEPYVVQRWDGTSGSRPFPPNHTSFGK